MFLSAGNNDWNDYYKAAPVASFFQSPYWAEIWSRYTSGKVQPASCLAEFPAGKKVLIPLSRQRLPLGLGKVGHAAPAGTYGGWLSQPDQILTTDEIFTLFQTLFDEYGSLILRAFPFAGIPVETIMEGTSKIPGITIHPDSTYTIDCSQGIDAIHKSWSDGKGGMKRKLQKAEKSGIRIRKAESRSDRDAYYKLYLENVRRWKPPPSHVYRRELFELLAEYDENCELWVAEFKDRMVAGSVIMTGNHHVAYWHGASDLSAGYMRPANLLLARLIELTCQRGHHWFDFNPSKGIAGVEKFKKSFGAQPFDTPVLQRFSGMYRLISVVSEYKFSVPRGCKFSMVRGDKFSMACGDKWKPIINRGLRA